MVIIPDILIAIGAAFLCRTMAVMMNYGLAYKQFLWPVKLYFARLVDQQYVDNTISKIQCVSYGDKVVRKMFDYLSNRSFIIALLDCPFCMGFWISMIVALLLCSWSLSWACMVIIPVMTFFFIEKI